MDEFFLRGRKLSTEKVERGFVGMAYEWVSVRAEEPDAHQPSLRLTSDLLGDVESIACFGCVQYEKAAVVIVVGGSVHECSLLVSAGSTAVS